MRFFPISLPIQPRARRARRWIIAAALVAAACDRGAAAPPSIEVVDDFGDPVALEPAPRRIVSLNPATTEILFAIGAGPRLVGRTHWDAQPDSARLLADLGNGIRPNVEAVLGVRPDLVVLYASADNRDAARAFRAAGVRTVALRVDRISQFQSATELLGKVVGDTARARVVVDTVTATLERVRAATARLDRPTVFWKAWDAPLLAIGGGSFMTELLDIAGARNVYGHMTHPSPAITLEDVVRRDPDVIVAGANSATVFRANPAWRAVRAVREGRILVVDTTLLAFPAVRLGQAAVTLANAIHPGAVR